MTTRSTSWSLAGLRPFALTPDERRDLMAFLESLTDREALRDPRWSDPWK